MMNNQDYYSSINAYLLDLGWEQNATNNRTMVIWTKTDTPNKILMPTEEFVDDEHAPILYSKAITTLATSQNITEDDVHNKLGNYVSYADVICIRSSGAAIEHGRINLFSGSKSLSAISALIKAFAEKNAIAKKGFKKQMEEHYLNCMNLVVPHGGSFIHRIEVDLKPFKADAKSKPEENHEIDHEPCNRTINVKLAQLLIALRDIDPEKVTMAQLLQIGVTERVSTNLIEVFSEEADKVEYGFNWSPSYQAPSIATNIITFNRGHRETFKKIKAAFADTRTFRIEDEIAHIEGFMTPEDGEPSLVLKLKLDGRIRSCEVIAERSIVEQLMAEMSQDSKQSVAVSGKVTRIDRSGKQPPVYFLSEATITASNSRQIPLIG